MAIDTKPNFNNGKFEQCVGDIMNLSGCTQIYGVFDIETSATLTICENAGDGKILTSDATGVATWQTSCAITAISGGSGMNFSPITTTGEIILGIPSAILNTSTDVSSGTTHNHAFSASTFVTGTQGILVDGNNRFYLDDVYITDSVLSDLQTIDNVTSNQSLGSLPSGQTLGMVYITNTGTTAATINLGTSALSNDITPFQPIDIDAGEDVSITVNMRLSLTENKTIFINSDDWTNVALNVQWASVTFKNVPLPTGGTGGLTSSSNGLSDDGTTVKLGGTLSENTTINFGTGGNSSIFINNTSGNIDIYNVDATNTSYGNIYAYPTANSPVVALLAGDQASISSDLSVYNNRTVICGGGANDFDIHFGNSGIYALQQFTGNTDCHFVQKSYVDSLSGGSYTFSDGLTESAGTVKLGGNYAAGMWFYPTAVAGSAYFGLCNNGTIDQYAEDTSLETWLNMSQSVSATPAMCIETGVAAAGACYASRFRIFKDCIRFFGCTNNRLNAEVRYDENGFKYTTDVSSQWTGATANRYLVDKEYVDSMSGGTGVGIIADGDTTPNVGGNNVLKYSGTTTANTNITDLDNSIIGAIYTIVGGPDDAYHITFTGSNFVNKGLISQVVTENDVVQYVKISNSAPKFHMISYSDNHSF